MADQSISIRLALTDGGKVKAELVDIGASGQKALERIRDAAQPASRGLQALDVAGHAVRGKIQEMAGSAGVLGEALQNIGPYGLAAAAGVGAVTVALGFAMNKAREVTEHFDTLADQAARIGTSVESFQQLVYAFGQIGVKADATETALTRLNDVIGDVMIQGAKTPAEVARAFDQLGISMADVQKHGSDLDWMLAAMAEGMKSLGTQAERTAVAKALMGKQAAALLPLLAEGAARLREQTQAASDAGAVLGKDLVQRYDEFGDRLDAVGQIMQTQAGRLFPEIAEGTVLFAEAVATLTTNVADLLDDLRQELGANIFKEIAEWAFSALKPIQEVLGLVNGIWNFVKSHQPSGSTGEAMVDDLLAGQGAPAYTTGGGFGGAPAAAVRLPTPMARPVDVPHGSGRGGWPQLKEEAGGGKTSEAEKEAEQVAELIAKAHLAADAEERLAKAAGVSSTALRQAANDNKVAAFAQEHGATAAQRYRVEIERASDAEQRRQINATVLGLTQQADAAERVAAAQGHGAAAAHLATLQNQAFAEALKAGAAGSKEFKAAYDAVLEQLQRKDAADTLAGFNEELQARQDALAVDQKQLSLMDQSAGKRAELVASLQEELRLRQQFPGLTQEQIDQLTQLSAADAKVKAQIKEREEAERDFALIARQGISDVVGGLKEVVQGAKTWREALLGVAQSFGKIAEQQLVDKPLSQAIDRWFSGSDTGTGTGKSDFGKIGELLSGGWSWLEGQLGFGGTPAGQGQTTAQLATATGGGASGGSSLRGLGAAAGALNQSAQQLGQAGAAGQLGSAGKALGAMPGIFQSVLGSMVGTMTVNAALVNVNGGASGGSAGGGVLGQIGGWFSSLFGSGGYGTTGGEGPGGSAASASTMTSGGTNPGFLLGGAAYGAVFEGGNVIPFARGGIVERPTLFPMARGMGLMGEAGPEAVLPLRRLPSGRLGVESGGKAGGGGHTVSVNVVVNGGDQATADRFRRTAAQAARDALLAAEEHKRRFG